MGEGERKLRERGGIGVYKIIRKFYYKRVCDFYYLKHGFK